MERFFFFTLLSFILLTTSSFSHASTRCNNPQGSFQCMICNCYNEAGNEPYTGQVAVGEVVMSRVGSPHFPNSICGVIKQRKQFSWYNSVFTRKAVPTNHSCIKAAQKAMTFRGCKADHYHATYVRPRWRRRMRRVGRIRHHIFYSKFCHRTNLVVAMQKQERAVGSRYSRNRSTSVIAQNTSSRNDRAQARPVLLGNNVRFASATPDARGFWSKFFNGVDR